MRSKLQLLLKILSGTNELADADKNEIVSAVKSMDKEMALAEFKLARLEKEKKTLTILLEETIEELEKKRKAVEAQNRELEIEAALERVRSRTMAMQRSDELSETASVLFQQFKELGEDPLQISIGTINERQRIVEMRITDWSGSGSQVNRAFSLSIEEPTLISKLYKAWKEDKRSIVIELTGRELENWITYRNTTYGIPVRAEDVQGSRVVSCAFFSQGMLCISTPEARSHETVQLIERFAGVFDLTYTRFLDLKQAEAMAAKAEHDLILLKQEKKRTEDALTELRATQAQLIHTEKMASLGELTAGIAHEIQNPLNFINNFSELSMELLDEAKEDIRADRKKEAIRALEDVEENLQKVIYHGKRADSIVKSMLQHSRAGSGTKELTDINTLAAEYLRLAYHGLRAKDKAFNAILATAFDDSIRKIEVVPQDIGRVLLNLYNNAFYAVNEKKKQVNGSFEPTIAVSTKITGSKAEICIRDNGTGIPQKVLDKIYQPFFTTKPTGEGVGLGLSLSYDIITKGHGGEMKVETKEGEGTEFVIALPFQQNISHPNSSTKAG